MTDQLLGPLAALALALMVLGGFLTNKILARGTVLREDYDKVMSINASYAEALPLLTKAINDAVAVIRHQQQNGGL